MCVYSKMMLNCDIYLNQVAGQINKRYTSITEIVHTKDLKNCNGTGELHFWISIPWKLDPATYLQSYKAAKPHRSVRIYKIENNPHSHLNNYNTSTATQILNYQRTKPHLI